MFPIRGECDNNQRMGIGRWLRRGGSSGAQAGSEGQVGSEGRDVPEAGRAQKLRVRMERLGLPLAEPTPAAELDALERAAGIQLPAAYRAVFSRIGAGPCQDGTLVPPTLSHYPEPARADRPSPLTAQTAAPRAPGGAGRRDGLLRLTTTWEQDPATDVSVPFDEVLVVTGELTGRVAYVDWAGNVPVRLVPGSMLDWLETWVARQEGGADVGEVVGHLPPGNDDLLTLAAGTARESTQDQERALGLLGSVEPLTPEQLRRLHHLALLSSRPVVAVSAVALALRLVDVSGCPECRTPGACERLPTAARRWSAGLPEELADPLLRVMEDLGMAWEEPSSVAPEVLAVVRADEDVTQICRLLDRLEGHDLTVVATAFASRHRTVLAMALDSIARVKPPPRIPARLYANPDPQIRRRAVALQNPPVLLADLPELTRLAAQEADVSVRHAWASALAGTGDPGIAGYVAAVLATEQDTDVLAVALQAVRDVPLRALTAQTIPFTRHPAPAIRYTAAAALGNLGDNAARPALLALTRRSRSGSACGSRSRRSPRPPWTSSTASTTPTNSHTSPPADKLTT